MHISDEIDQLADILGRDSPAVQKALLRMAINPKEAPYVRDQFCMMAKKLGYDPTNLPAFPVRVEQAVTDGVVLGNIVIGDRLGEPVVISKASVERNLLIGGLTGSGKTTEVMMICEQLQRMGIIVVIFEDQEEHKKLLIVFPTDSLVALRPEQDKDNPFQPPTGVSIEEWIEKIISLLRECWFLRDGSCNLLRDILVRVFGRHGWFEGKGERYPTVRDVIAELESLDFKPGTRHAGYLETLRNRFKGLGPLAKTFDCEKGYPIEELLKRSVIFRLSGLSDDHRLFYTSLKLIRLCSYREKLGDSDELKYFIVIEEAHKFCSPKLEKRNDLVEPIIFILVRTIRKRGGSIALIEQVPASLPYQLLGNINTKIVQRLGDTRSIYQLAEVSLLNEKQAEQIPVLPSRQAVLRSPEFSAPILFQIPEKTYTRVTEEQVQESTNRILATMEFVPAEHDGEATDQSEAKQGNNKIREWMSEKDPHRKVLEDIRSHPYDCMKDRRQRLGGWSPWYMTKTVDELEQAGLIKEPVSLNLGARGNPKKMLQITEKGAQCIGANYESLQLKGKGSDEHRFLQNMLAEKCRSEGKITFVEYTLNGKSADVVILSDDLTYHSFEIELDPTNPHVLENVKRDLECFATCTVVSRNQEAEREIRTRVQKEMNEEQVSRTQFKLLKDYLS